MPEANKRYALSTAAGLTDEIIEIGGREFHGWALKLDETNEFSNTVTFDEQLEPLAKALEKRALDDKPVTTEFLAKSIDQPFLRKLMRYLINGSVEGSDPKA